MFLRSGLRVARLLLTTLAVFTALALVGSATAFACSTGLGPHIYGVFRKGYATANSGLYAYVYVPKSGVSDYAQGGFIDGTIWEGVDSAKSVAQYWIETGWSHGWNDTPDYTYYWARNTSQHGYAQHKVTNLSLTVDTWMPMEVVYAGSSNWQVYLDQKLVYDSNGGEYGNIDATLYSYAYQGGIESTSANSWAGTGYWDSLEDEQGGSWTSSIDSGSTIYCDPPSTAGWVSGKANIDFEAAFG